MPEPSCERVASQYCGLVEYPAASLEPQSGGYLVK